MLPSRLSSTAPRTGPYAQPLGLVAPPPGSKSSIQGSSYCLQGSQYHLEGLRYSSQGSQHIYRPQGLKCRRQGPHSNSIHGLNREPEDMTVQFPKPSDSADTPDTLPYFLSGLMSPGVASKAHNTTCKAVRTASRARGILCTAPTTAFTAPDAAFQVHQGLRYSLLGPKCRIFVVQSTTIQAASIAVKARNAAFKLPATKTDQTRCQISLTGIMARRATSLATTVEALTTAIQVPNKAFNGLHGSRHRLQGCLCNTTGSKYSTQGPKCSLQAPRH